MADLTSFVKELNSMINTPADVTSVASTIASTVAATTAASASNSTRKVKVLIVTTHVNQVNGYSKVIYNIIKQLATHSWIQLVHFGTQKLTNADLGRTYPKDVKVIDATALDKDKTPGFAISKLPSVITTEKPDVVFIYNDLSVICAYIEEIRKVISNRSFKIWAYVDTTYVSAPQGMIDVLNRDVERIFCFTKGWKESIKSQGLNRPVDVMNHGIDPGMFRTIPRDLARQTLGLPKDIFLFTSLNRNIPRKRLDLLVMSFVQLIIKFPTKPIYILMVADKGEQGGHQIFDIFSRELKLHNAAVEMFGNRLMLTSKDTCYRDEDINMLYNASDAGVSCAEGEGFGLCSFEQMAVGVPQVVPEINGYTEYCTEENSLLVKPSMRYYIPQAHYSVTGEAQIVNPEEFAKAMERYVFDESLRKNHGRLAKESVVAYTWESCVATMLKRLRLIQEEDE
jgi:glycosyltransferase involved in cell wall biosynthesis